MRRVLVTGGGGFLGTPVVRRLQEAGYDVSVPRSHWYDLRTRQGVKGALDFRPDVVVHLAAAVGGIGANEAHPGLFLYENAIMGLELMEQARWMGVRKFVTIGTACEYPENASLPLREDTIWDGYPTPATAPYGLAKRMLLAQGQSYRTEYGFNAIHLIPTNLYGPGDNFDPDTGHVIAGLVRKFSDAIRYEMPVVRLWGSGQTTREFLFVEDAAAAIVMATESYDGADPVNIGTGVETTIASLAERIAWIYGFQGEIEWDPDRPDGVARRWMDVSRADKEFGFRAITSLEDGLARTVQSYEASAA